jgi:hypothetical protein
VRRDLFGAKSERADNERVIALRQRVRLGHVAVKEADQWPADTANLSDFHGVNWGERLLD